MPDPYIKEKPIHVKCRTCGSTRVMPGRWNLRHLQSEKIVGYWYCSNDHYNFEG